MIETTLHILFLLTAAPLLLGVINKVKAAFGGRVGPPVLQPYYDVIKLLQKGSVFSSTTTWVFRAGPVVGLATAIIAGLLVPFGGKEAPVSFAGDLVLFAYLLGLGRFFTMAAALDTGSAFEGMGAAREATWSCLAEPALFFALIVLVRLSGSMSLGGMLGAGVTAGWQGAGASLVLIGATLFIVLLVESSRIPFDDPNTHLELTMVHEVMVLDHGGPGLGMILYGAAVKLLLLGALVVRVAVPLDGYEDAWVRWTLFGAGMLGVAVAIGVVESVMARLRLTQVPSLLVAANILASFGVVLLSVRS